MSTLLVLEADRETVGVLRSRAEAWGLTVDAEPADAGLRALEAGAADVEAVVVGAVPDPIRTAQRTHLAAPHVPIVLIGSEEECHRLLDALRLTAFVGREVGCVARHPDAAFLEGVTVALERGRRARRLQQTLGALNRKLQDTPPAAPPFAVGLLGRLLEVAPIGVVLTDRERRIRAVNRLGTMLFHEEERRLLGQDLATLLPESARGELVRILDPERGGDTRSIEAIELTGEPRTWVDLAATPLDPDSGGPGFLVLLDDVTDRVELVEQLRDAVQRKDAFLAMLGHELRNPLAPIRSALDLMRLRGDDPSTRRERAIIGRHVDHMVHLVDDLLDVARITRGELALYREPFEICEVVADAIDMARPLLVDRQHTLTVDVPDEGLPVHADARRLTQVFTNLLTNAAKYTDPGGRIRVEGRQVDDLVVVTVRDTGRGIEPALVATVFDPFVQGPQGIERASGGLGLGLAIVRSLVELHGGRVHVESTLGVGSALEVRLPRAGSEQADPEPGVEDEQHEQ